MATRKKSSTAGMKEGRDAVSTDGIHRIYVRIGALRRFHTLTQKTADLPVEVSWDRRREDRREAATSATGGERRQSDRRQKPPFTWEMADFVLVEAPPEPKKKR